MKLLDIGGGFPGASDSDGFFQEVYLWLYIDDQCISCIIIIILVMLDHTYY